MPATWPFGSLMTVPTHSLSAALTVARFRVPSLGTQHDGHLSPANQGLLGSLGRRLDSQSSAAELASRGHCCGHQEIAPLH